jgi:hypothetical protein
MFAAVASAARQLAAVARSCGVRWRGKPIRFLTALAAFAAAQSAHVAHGGIPIPGLVLRVLELSDGRAVGRVDILNFDAVALIRDAPFNLSRIILSGSPLYTASGTALSCRHCTVARVDELAAAFRAAPHHRQLRTLVVNVVTPEENDAVDPAMTAALGRLAASLGQLRELRSLTVHAAQCDPVRTVDPRPLLATATQLRHLDLWCWPESTPFVLPAQPPLRSLMLSDSSECPASVLGLAHVAVPVTVMVLRDCFLEHCTSVTSVHFSSKLRSIGDLSCRCLLDITAMDLTGCHALRRIGDNFANGCSALTTVVLPDGVAEIGRNFLFYCESLVTVAFGAALLTLGDNPLVHTAVDAADLSHCVGLHAVPKRMTTRCRLILPPQLVARPHPWRD